MKLCLIKVIDWMYKASILFGNLYSHIQAWLTVRNKYTVRQITSCIKQYQHFYCSVQFSFKGYIRVDRMRHSYVYTAAGDWLSMDKGFNVSVPIAYLIVYLGIAVGKWDALAWLTALLWL